MEEQKIQQTIQAQPTQPVYYYDPRLLPPPPPPASVQYYYYDGLAAPANPITNAAVVVPQTTQSLYPQQQEEDIILENDIENKRNMNEAFHYSTSNYMNWTLPYYTAQSYTDSSIPVLNQSTSSLNKTNITQDDLDELEKLKVMNQQILEHSEFAFSLLIFLLGFFLYVPWFFGYLYVRSKSAAARRLGVLSLVLAFCSMVAIVFYFTIFEDVTIEYES